MVGAPAGRKLGFRGCLCRNHMARAHQATNPQNGVLHSTLLWTSLGNPMATLYAENVPDERYQALREQARRNHRSIAGEVIELLREHVPTRKELAARQATIRRLQRIR